MEQHILIYKNAWRRWNESITDETKLVSQQKDLMGTLNQMAPILIERNTSRIKFRGYGKYGRNVKKSSRWCSPKTSEKKIIF